MFRNFAVPHTDLPSLVIRNKTLLPVVQGGMGVGVSAHRLAGTVAGLGGLGTISSVDLRRHHADLMAQTGRSRDKAAINAANLVALDREVRTFSDAEVADLADLAALTMRELDLRLLGRRVLFDR